MITIQKSSTADTRTCDKTKVTKEQLLPVPKGMCSAFYEFMGAGGVRSDSGEILMIGDHSDDQETKGLESL